MEIAVPDTTVPRASVSSLTPALLIIVWLLITLSIWSFAFWHAPNATPEWLLRAQAACFGIDETGLPDTYGWLVLILAPLSFLAAAVVVYGKDIVLGLRRLFESTTGRLVGIALLSCLAAEGWWVAGRIRSGLAVINTSYLSAEAGELPAQYPRLSQFANSFILTNQHGENISIESFRGQPILLSFAFAHCETVCPAVVQQVLAAARQFPPGSIGVLIVTLDPWRDTPGALPGLAKSWNLKDREYVLSGPVDEVTSMHAKYHMEIKRDERSGDITHPSPVYVIDAAGRISYVFNNPPPRWLVGALHRLQAEPLSSTS